MTRLLHIIASADPRGGGPIEGARTVGEVWLRQGHVQDLVTMDLPGALYLDDFPGRVFAMGAKRWSRLRYGFAPGMVRWIRDHAREYDAVLVSGLWNFATLAARLGLIGRDIPYFIYTHGMLDPWFKQYDPVKNVAKQLSWLVNEGPLLRHARAVLFTTTEEERLADRAFFPYRVRGKVVGYGTADAPDDADAQGAAFRALLPVLDGRRFLLFISRIHPKKGCDLLIDAFAGIAARQPDLDLVIAGPDHLGTRAQLEAQAAARGLTNRVHFPGMLSGPTKWGAFRACEAMTLISHQENFGVVVAEALACGRPVLISDKVNICGEVIADGVGLVESDTPEGARRLFDRFLALTPAQLAGMRVAARDSFLRRFTAAAAADMLMQVIEREIQAGPR